LRSGIAATGGNVPYATIDDVFGRYKPINTMVGIGSYDVTSVQVSSIFVADAESFVDAYLGARYEVPLAVICRLAMTAASPCWRGSATGTWS
jgi:phage gp36-like protein